MREKPLGPLPRWRASLLVLPPPLLGPGLSTRPGCSGRGAASLPRGMSHPLLQPRWQVDGGRWSLCPPPPAGLLELENHWVAMVLTMQSSPGAGHFPWGRASPSELQEAGAEALLPHTD